MQSTLVTRGSMVVATALLAAAVHAQPAQRLEIGTEATGALSDRGTNRWAIQSSEGVGYRLEVTQVPAQLDVSVQGLPGRPVNSGGKGQDETASFDGDGTLMVIEVVSLSGGGFYEIKLTAPPKPLALETTAKATLGTNGTHKWQIQTSPNVDYRLEVTSVAAPLDVSLKGLQGQRVEDAGGKGKGETVEFQGDGTPMTVAIASVGGAGSYQIEVAVMTPCDKGFRYADQGDGTVLDCATAVLWLKEADCPDLRAQSGTGKLQWQDAVAATEALADGKCGLSDGSSPGEWRLPTLSEFCEGAGTAGICPAEKAADSLIDSAVQGSPKVANARGGGPWSDGDPFVGVEPSRYWSSTTGKRESWVWIADLSDGSTRDTFKGTHHLVWPVRDIVGDLGVLGGTTQAAPRTRAQLVREIIDEHLAAANLKEKYLYLAPDITQTRLDNAAELHGFDKSKVLLMYDSSTGESGKAGFCLTDRKVYTRLGWAEDSYSLDYEDIKQAVREGSNHFRINEHMLVKTEWSEDPKRSAESYAELLEKIRDELLVLEAGSE